MGKIEKLLVAVLSGRSDGNIAFADLCSLLTRLGFSTRTKGSHHIYWREGIAEIINIQEKKGKAKPYQVRQVRELIIRYRLAEALDE